MIDHDGLKAVERKVSMMHEAATTTEDWITNLVRAEDPLAGVVLPQTSDESERLRQRVLGSPRKTTSRHSIRTGPRKALVLVAVAALAIVAGVSVAFASGLLGGGNGERTAQLLGASAGVSDLRTLASSEGGHSNVVEGTEAGVAVATATVGGWATPFVPVSKLLDGRSLYLSTGAGGSPGSVDWVAVAGLVSDRVTRVELISDSGVVKPLDLTSGAFAVEVSPAFNPAAVVAYDRDGKEVGRAAIPEHEAPPK